MLEKETKQNLLEGRFFVDLKEIFLTQLHVDTPIIFRGPGTIAQNESGDLCLKLFMNHDMDFMTLLDHCRPDTTLGKISGPSSFYKMEATEYSGTVWHCTGLRIAPPSYVNPPNVTGIVSSNLASIEQRSTPIKYEMIYQFRGIIPGTLAIPYDRNSVGSLKGYPKKRMRFHVQENIDVELEDDDTSVIISVGSMSPDLTPEIIGAILEAISIGIGRPVACIFSYFNGSTGYSKSIDRFNFQSGQHSIPTLISADNSKSFKDFVNRYVNFSMSYGNEYFGYWNNIHSAWSAGLAVSALPLSVYIEGIVQEFFPEYIRADLLTKKAAIAASAAIDELKIDSNLRNRFQGALKNIGGGSSSDGLRLLADEGWFDNKCVRIWKIVRNKSAHAVDFNRVCEYEKIQEIYTGVYTCLHIFYVLLIVRIGFRGFMHDYSKLHFPSVGVNARSKKKKRK